MLNTEKLKKLMEHHGFNNRKLADAIGVTEQFVHYMVNGKKQPSLAVYSDMCNVLGVSKDELVVD